LIDNNKFNFNPLVTVAMPVFNGAIYLEQSIRSILNQSYRKFEFIIIDDGSTDNSYEIIQHYAKLDNRIICLSQKNQGISNTLNKIIEICNGEFLARMDCDDISLPNRLIEQIEWMALTNSDISGSSIVVFNEFMYKKVKYPILNEEIYAKLLFSTPFAHPTVMIKTKVIKKLKYNCDFDKAEDYELWVRAAKNNCVMTNIPKVLLYYRLHNNQVSKKYLIMQKNIASKIRLDYFLYIYNSSVSISDIERFFDLENRLFLFTSSERMFLFNFFSKLFKSNNSNYNSIVFKQFIFLYLGIVGKLIYSFLDSFSEN